MNLNDALTVIESAPGFSDETTPVGEAWAVVLASLNPAPEPPADGEVAKLVQDLRRLAWQNPLGITDPRITRAADLLAQRHPAPVPVSKRPPGPKDCDAIGSCWWYSESHGWELYHRENALGTSTHWLPAHALPLPAEGGK